MEIEKFRLFLTSSILLLTFCTCEKNSIKYTEKNNEIKEVVEGILTQEDILNKELTGNDIFEQNIFHNIFESPDYYIDNNNFSYKENIPENRIKSEPEKYITVENNEIRILFTPDYYSIGYEEWKLNEKYKLQFITIKEETDNYFFGKYIGKASEEIMELYPNFDGKITKTGESHIMYSSKGWDKFINFTLEDNIVTEITFGYEP